MDEDDYTPKWLYVFGFFGTAIVVLPFFLWLIHLNIPYWVTLIVCVALTLNLSFSKEDPKWYDALASSSQYLFKRYTTPVFLTSCALLIWLNISKDLHIDRFFIVAIALVLAGLYFKFTQPPPPKVYIPEVYVEPSYVPPPKYYPPMPTISPLPNTQSGSANWDNPNIIADLYSGGDVNADIGEGFYIGAEFKIRAQMHGVCVAGSGQGKGVCIILPNLLSAPNNSWFVLDPKGENALVSASFQKWMGQRVVILDPWNEQKRHGATHGIEPSGFNPLAFVKGNPDELPESCGVIARMLVPEGSGEKEEYWSSRARSLIKTYLLHIITARPETEQNLATLFDWLRLTIKERGPLWVEMMQSTACNGLVRKSISQFFDLDPYDGSLPGIITTAQDNTDFLESEALRISLSKNDFDVYDLTDGRTTVYVCLPERFISTHARWLRLVVGVSLKACNYKPRKRVNFLLDEFAILGKMTDVQDGYVFARGQQVCLYIFVQSLSQLNTIYGENGASTFLACSRLRQFFGVFDLSTQKYLSEYLGDTTIKVESKTESYSIGGSSGWTVGGTETGSTKMSYGTSDSHSISVTRSYSGRRLLTSEEIGKNSNIITFLDGHKFLITRLPFWIPIENWLQQGKSTYYPKNLNDWHNHLDKMANLGPVTQSRFAERADGQEVKIDDSRKMMI